MSTVASTARDRKRAATRRQIADAAARFATEHGIAATTADDIADAAGVGRATLFRHFESKELAIATGLSDVAVFVLSSAIMALPASLGPFEAIRTAQAVLGEDFETNREMFLDQAHLSRSSPSMWAWTLHVYVDWEIAIANAVAPRYRDLAPDDPRPRMLGALTMAASRLACDEWLAGAGTGDLPALTQRYLTALGSTLT